MLLLLVGSSANKLATYFWYITERKQGPELALVHGPTI